MRVETYVLDENTPGDGPLLKRNDTTANVLGCNLGLVDGDNGGTDTNCPTANDTTDAKEGHAVRGSLKDGAHDPHESGDLDGSTAREAIGQEGGGEGADQGARRHRSRDAALTSTSGTIEVALVSLGAQDTGHGRDVETEERTADGGKAANG